jgi:HlyD family secretion protein
LDLIDPYRQWSLLGHDYRVHVQITVWQTPKATLVPLGALFRKGDRWATFRVQDGRAHLQLVTIGQQNKSIAEVKAGLSAGERVILHPSDRIVDGTRIVERAQLD